MLINCVRLGVLTAVLLKMPVFQTVLCHSVSSAQ